MSNRCGRGAAGVGERRLLEVRRRLIGRADAALVFSAGATSAWVRGRFVVQGGSTSKLACRRYVSVRRSFRREVVAVNGFPLRVWTAGAADADTDLVLVAGLGLSGRYLLPAAARLAHNARVWVPDLPGYLRVSQRGNPLEMVDLARLVLAWLDAAGLDCVDVYGNSMGCQVAVELAAVAPDRVSRVVLEGPTVDATARTLPKQARRVAIDAFREPLSLGLLQLTDWARARPRVLRRMVRATFDHPVEQRLPDVTCCAYVVRGSRDAIVPHEWALRVAAALPRGELHTIEHASHAQTYSNPDQLAALITQLLGHGRSDEPRQRVVNL